MALLGQFDDAADTRSQELQKGDWAGLRRLLGQEVVSATTSEQPNEDETTETAVQVFFFCRCLLRDVMLTYSL